MKTWVKTNKDLTFSVITAETTNQFLAEKIAKEINGTLLYREALLPTGRGFVCYVKKCGLKNIQEVKAIVQKINQVEAEYLKKFTELEQQAEKFEKELNKN